jgi:hypothetical protein
MAGEPNRVALRHIDRLFQAGTLTGLDEGQLLGRFVAHRDEASPPVAFQLSPGRPFLGRVVDNRGQPVAP